LQEGDLAGAKEATDAVLELVRAVGDLGSEAMVSFNAAVLLGRMGRAGEAIGYGRRAVELGERTGHPALGQMREFLAQLEQVVEG